MHAYAITMKDARGHIIDRGVIHAADMHLALMVSAARLTGKNGAERHVFSAEVERVKE